MVREALTDPQERRKEERAERQEENEEDDAADDFDARVGEKRLLARAHVGELAARQKRALHHAGRLVVVQRDGGGGISRLNVVQRGGRGVIRRHRSLHSWEFGYDGNVPRCQVLFVKRR